jgi:excinuclease UvrABC ATPase subunit
MSVRNSLDFFKTVKLSKTEEKIAKNIFKNICERLDFLS